MRQSLSYTLTNRIPIQPPLRTGVVEGAGVAQAKPIDQQGQNNNNGIGFRFHFVSSAIADRVTVYPRLVRAGKRHIGIQHRIARVHRHVRHRTPPAARHW